MWIILKLYQVIDYLRDGSWTIDVVPYSSATLFALTGPTCSNFASIACPSLVKLKKSYKNQSHGNKSNNIRKINFVKLVYKRRHKEYIYVWKFRETQINLNNFF